jgi:hypothetical protein
MAESGKPGRGDAALIAALAAGASVRAAARSAGVSERTAHRRLEDPPVQQAVEDARAEILARAVAKLTAASTEAAETLRRLLYSPMDFARLAAARSILELGSKLREHEDLAERVAALERRLSGTGEGKEPPSWPRTA